MFQTLEAVIDQKGTVQLVEAVQLPRKHRALVTILEDEPEPGAPAVRPFGLCLGEFVVPEDFDAPLPPEILGLFEGV